ncbi:MAG: hypothetical protein AAGH64_05425 [Planctomycetota bacterium]
MSVRAVFVCPACDYDVTRTLDDQIETCPECGGPITGVSCADDLSFRSWLRSLRAYFSIAVGGFALLTVVSIACGHASAYTEGSIAGTPVAVCLIVSVSATCVWFVVGPVAAWWISPRAIDRREVVFTPLAYVMNIAVLYVLGAIGAL